MYVCLCNNNKSKGYKFERVWGPQNSWEGGNYVNIVLVYEIVKEINVKKLKSVINCNKIFRFWFDSFQLSNVIVETTFIKEHCLLFLI